jgi:hypothetical protein
MSTTERVRFVGRVVVPSPPWSPSTAQGIQGWHCLVALAVILLHAWLVLMLERGHDADGGTGHSDDEEGGSSTWSNSYLDRDA